MAESGRPIPGDPAPDRAGPADSGGGSRALLLLWLLEAGLLIIGLGIYKGHWLAAASLWSRAGLTVLVGFAIVCTAAALLLGESRRVGSRLLLLALAGNVATVFLMVLAAEAILRAVAITRPDTTRIGSLNLATTWPELLQRNRDFMDRISSGSGDWPPCHASDPLLGWTIAPNCSSPDGLYFSSAEGLRSAGPNLSYRVRKASLRIALVGDSFSFGQDGPFEDSYGFALERILGPDVQVLNFGVSGYGMDQSFLRYQRDVRPWRPDIVLFEFVGHDIARVLSVYPFLSFGWNFPFAKPRFILESDRLRLLNTPLPAPEELLNAARFSDLPYIEYDYAYHHSDWAPRSSRPWMIWRLWTTLVPRWPIPGPHATDADAVAVSAKVLDEFGRIARADGATPLILYFPTPAAGDLPSAEYRGTAGGPGRELAHDVLSRISVEQLDLTTCVQAVPPADRIVRGGSHYAAPANLAVAECVASHLRSRG